MSIALRRAKTPYHRMKLIEKNAMSEEVKRKSNSRRRLLLRLLLGIGILVALISVGIYALRPTGAQIVFIAPDDNGVDNLWIADLNNPEHPRQLTFHEIPVEFLQVAERTSVLLYEVRIADNWFDFQLWYMNLNSGKHEMIPITCSDGNCNYYNLSPNGKWISYPQIDTISEDNFIYRVLIYNLQSRETYQIHEQHYNIYPSVISHFSSWVGHTNQLAYRIKNVNTDEEDIILYNVEENRTTGNLTMPRIIAPPVFSNDGSNYHISNFYITKWIPQIFVNDNKNPVEPFNYYADYGTETSLLTDIELQDWHPNNVTVMFAEAWLTPSTSNNYVVISLYNTATSTKETILEVFQHSFYRNFATFNHSGNQILYDEANIEAQSMQIKLFDLRSNERNALPLFGHSPQWVNGGR